MGIDKPLYLEEMKKLLRKARRRWLKEHADAEIYSINVWTDPGACASAVNIDTREHSKTTVAHAKRFARRQRDHDLRVGDKELAKLFDAWKNIDREVNPAEFAFTRFAEINHRSFDDKWGASARCWRSLGPLLLQVRQMTADTFGDLKLHRDAEASINSAKDWCDGRVKLKALQPKPRSNRR